MNTGTDLARDIQTGFMNRLSLTPMRGIALLAGQLGGVVVLGLFQAVVYIAVGLIAGVRFASGPAGVARPARLLHADRARVRRARPVRRAAHRLGRGVQGLFPAFFVFLFISSMAIPRNLIEVTWFREVATVNPVSYLIEGVRSLIMVGWDGEALALGFGVAARRSPWSRSALAAGRCARGWPAREDARGRPGRRVADAAQLLHEHGAADPVARSSRSSSSPPSRAGCRASGTCPASTSRAATRRSSSCSCCCSRRRSAASSPASGSRATSRAASPGGCCSPRRTAAGSSLGYAIAGARAAGWSRRRC